MRLYVRKTAVHMFMIALVVAVGSLLTTIQAFAQSVPEKVDVDINTGGGSAWYGQPWVWALGIALFIIILVAITRGGSKSKA
ncbi:MAG: hypothetical protein H7096_12350 [Flavobacterium sp.]|nr:hypothetical protein [Pedobacter sp.]